MNSVISLDGNDIFAVARMFEQMNINELGDITETIPPELQFLTKTAVLTAQPIMLGNLG